jgi:hypothetical protein
MERRGRQSDEQMKVAAKNSGGTALNFLVEGFDIFGVHIQYWMPLAVLIAVIAIAYVNR